MTGTDLEDRLAGLADEEFRATSPLPDELWTRGRRWQRRRRLVGAVVTAGVTACVVGLVATVLPAVVEPRPAVPVTSEVAPRVPDRLFSPSPWLGMLTGTPLVAVGEAQRGTWSGAVAALVGVSSLSGEYGYLDLPDRASGAALSPDGEQLAYWLAGVPSGDPQTLEGQERTTTGLAVRNLRTGRERRHWIETEHGVQGEELFWMDDTTLVFEYGQHTVGDDAPVEEQGASQSWGGWWWQVESGNPARWPWDEVPDPAFWSARDGKVLGSTDDRTLMLLNPRAKRSVLVRGEAGVGVSHNMAGTLAFGTEGRVAIYDADGGPGEAGGVAPVRVGRLVQDGVGAEISDQTTVPATRWIHGLLGWRDDQVLVVAMPDNEGSEEGQHLDVMSVDVDSGERRTVVRDVSDGAWTFARGVLETGEVAEAQSPPTPFDPRLVTAGWALGLVAVLAAFLLWRRRGRP